MAEQIYLPGYGGLTRFKEEYESKFQISPGAVLGMIILTIFLVILLNILFRKSI